MGRLLVFPATVLLCPVQAQQIDTYRYWYDDASTAAVTTSVSPTTELVLNTAWPTTGLVPGFHRVTMQVRDTNGHWSVPQTRAFTRADRPISGYRYWVNDDTGAITSGTVGPDAVVTLDALVDPGALPKDYNTVTIQFRDADAEWSAPMTTLFVKNAGPVNGYQYWIDEDIANAISASIGSAPVVDLVADLPTATTTGQHTFTIRFAGANGTWSVPLTTEFSFITYLEEIPGSRDILLFPNPVTGTLGLRLNAAAGARLDLALLGADGRLIRDLGVWTVNGDGYRNWEINDLPAGSYLLRIADGHRERDLRFVKR